MHARTSIGQKTQHSVDVRKQNKIRIFYKRKVQFTDRQSQWRVVACIGMFWCLIFIDGGGRSLNSSSGSPFELNGWPMLNDGFDGDDSSSLRVQRSFQHSPISHSPISANQQKKSSLKKWNVWIYLLSFSKINCLWSNPVHSGDQWRNIQRSKDANKQTSKQ